MLSQPDRTLADYLAMAIGPVLIMVLVGSVVFFLVEIGYRGPFEGRVRWTLFWFVLAAVLVSRISIEQGSSYGLVYGLVLGAATAFRLTQFLGAPVVFVPLLLLGLIWWCASKLTWDCTLIDDQADASGEGLLQRAGLDRTEPIALAAVREEPGLASPTDRIPGAPNKERPHAPGLWVIYFSLGALLVFGLGQVAIPAADTGARLHGFLLLCAYLAAALGLLLTTSFLGLRRYLRQRHLLMPSAMARAWFARGVFFILAVLLGAMLLPRPEGVDTLARLGARLQPLRQEASRYAWMRGDAAEGEGREIGEPAASDAANQGQPAPQGSEESADPASDTGERNEGPGSGKQSGGPSGSGEGGADATGSASEAGQGGQGDGDAGGNESRSESRSVSSPQPPNPMSSPIAVEWLRWLTVLAGLVLFITVLVRFWRQWLAALKARLKRPERHMVTSQQPASPRRGFGSYPNPFTSGMAERMTPAQLTAYTFEALEAWAADRGSPRLPEQTPAEFGQNIASALPDGAGDVLGSVRLYLHVAYGGVTPTPESTEVLKQLWNVLHRPGVSA